MKKIPVLIGILMIFSTSYAQDYKWELGVVGGINQRVFVDWNGHPFKVGFTTGMSAQRNIKKHFSLNTNLIFQQEKSHRSVNGGCCGSLPESDYDWTNYDQFLILPIMSRWSFGKRFKVLLDVGIQTEFFFRSKVFVDYAEHEQEEDRSFVGVSSREIDFAFLIGGGCSYSISDKLKVSLESRLAGAYWSDIRHLDDYKLQILAGVSYSLKQK